MAISKIKSESIDLTDTGYTFGDLLVSGDLTVDTDTISVNSSANFVQIGSGNNRTNFLSQSNGNLQIKNGIIFESGDAAIDNQIFTYRSNDLIFGTSGSERMRITSDNRVGIGNTALDIPGTSHDTVVVGSGTANTGIILNQSTSTNATFGFYNGNGNIPSARMLWSGSDSLLNFYTQNSGGTGESIRMTIDTSGDVGIGTTNPSARLEVEDAGTSNSVILKVTADDGGPYAFVVGNDTYSTTDTEGMTMYVSDAGVATLNVRGAGSELAMRTVGTERMRIDSSGNVGIGTSSPTENLHIQTPDSTPGTIRLERGTSGVGTGDAVGELIFATNDGSYTAYTSTNEVAKISAVSPNTFGDRYDLAFYTGIYTESTPGERLRITNDGKVGIGTTNPIYALHIQSDNPVLRITDSDSGTRRASLSLETAGGPWVMEATNDLSIRYSNPAASATNGSFITLGRITNPLIFGTNATEAMRIDSSGNLLVGTTHEYSSGSPGIVLHPIGTHGVTNSFSTAWSIPNNVSGLLFVQGGASGQYGGVSLFMLNKVNGFNATITQISGFAGDVSGYTSSWQLSGSNAFQLKHNIPNQTINYNLKFIGM